MFFLNYLYCNQLKKERDKDKYFNGKLLKKSNLRKVLTIV